MKEFKDQVSKLILDYFDKKIENVNWRNDTEFEDDIRSIIEELDEEVADIITNTSLAIDKRLEEWEADYNQSFMEELTQDQYERENELARCV